jgi:hypothetical protein
METLEPPPRSRWARFLVPLLFLAVIAAALGTLLVLMVSHIGTIANLPQKKLERQGLVRLAMICAVLLGLTLIVMFWMIVRFLGARFQKPPEHTATEHVDAWRLAGQRVHLDDGEEPEELPPPEDDEDKPPP